MNKKAMLKGDLTCNGYLDSLRAEREVTHDLLREAFVIAINGTDQQMRAFIQLLLIL